MAPNKLFNKNFALLFQGQLVSFIGSSVYGVGLVLWLKQETNSATLVGLLSMVYLIPGVLLGLLSGTIVDHYSRKKIIVIGDLIDGCLLVGVAGVMFLLPQAVDLTIFLLFMTSLISGTINAFFRPAVSAALPDIVPLAKVQAANSWLMSSTQTGIMLGQFIGGVLFRILGAPILMLANGVAFLFSAFSELFIDIPQPVTDKGSSWREMLAIFKRDTIDGLGYVNRTPGLKALFIASAAYNVFLGPFFVLLPFFVQDTLHAAPDWYGFIMAGMAAGVVLGSMAPKVLDFIAIKRSKVVIMGLFLQALAISVVGYSNSALTALLFFIFLGLVFGINGVLINLVLQVRTPSGIRGRMFGLLLAISTAPMLVAMGLVGVVADLLDQNIPLIYLACGVLTMPIPLGLIFSSGFHQLFALDCAAKTDFYSAKYENL